MKTIILPLFSLLLVAFMANTTFAQASITENGLAPTIVEIQFPNEMSSKRVRPVSTKHEYYMKQFDDSPSIQLERDSENPAKLHIKGRGTMNHIEIYEGDAAEEDYPVVEVPFRGVNYQEVNLSKLEDGEYLVRVTSNHTVTETLLELSTLGEN